MKYISTRGNYEKVESMEAIKLGMVPEGGLFVPEVIPEFTPEEIESMEEKKYQEIAYMVLNKYLTDYEGDVLQKLIAKAYNQDNFPVENITPIKKLENNFYILELWHGPTAAFKDMALQLMPLLLIKAVEKSEIDKDIVILVATSGDTGTAALEGFKNIEGIKIIVFYPYEGVSRVQEAQMTSVKADNTEVVGVKGNFDDCQDAVKKVFGDKEFNRIMEKAGYQFSSANSINWGRLVPQIIYYFAAYAQLVRKNEIRSGQKINITVPTGNFGNILSGYYAYRMGLPVNKFICASNENNILTDFINTGVYNINREFQKTISPSMDILISSNLERFLFEITDHNSEKIKNWYNQLKNNGKFVIDDKYKKIIQKLFAGEYSDEAETRETIKNIFEKYDYTVDPHTAVGIKANEKYLNNNDDIFPVIIDSTASPYKFNKAVVEAIKGVGALSKGEELQLLDKLKQLSKTKIHRSLKNINKQEVEPARICYESEIAKEIKNILEINNKLGG